jgi:hypothetical protein
MEPIVLGLVTNYFSYINEFPSIFKQKLWEHKKYLSVGLKLVTGNYHSYKNDLPIDQYARGWKKQVISAIYWYFSLKS